MSKEQGRSMREIVRDLCTFNPASSSESARLPHDCYMMFVGRLTNREYLQKLTRTLDSREQTRAKKTSFTMMETEEMEFFLEYVTLENDINNENIFDDRKNHFVYEDHFNPFLFDMVRRKSSYGKLKQVCRFYETKEGVNVDNIMIEHERRTALSTPYFIEKGLAIDDAQSAALALSFYTGTKSEAVSRGASLVARQANGQVIESKTKDEMNEAAVILFYLVKALSYIPYYWGYVTRACTLTESELKLYMPGCLITWIQFSSSKKGKEVAANFDFAHRNTFFKIYSLTGRPIKQFSNYEEEDEVLFLPHSTFFVFKHEIGFHGNQHIIYMRQVELGLSKWSILWVDDNIFDENWENKQHMETASAKALNLNVHFIPKSTTNSALSFLRSPFGQRLKNQDTFRIVTDMTRHNETPSHNAGARLIKSLRDMGFTNQCLIFIRNKDNAKKIIDQELNSFQRQSIQITTQTDRLRKFVNFDQ
ncbi:unnamed protein product [Rotaria sordida]|uniref:NAD(P)(+)--arginine ADP-ribosyltransferase n=1 Tax=Rotaria sordida TaxID=392033 RepID=A0A819U765_9BILA|nr:unnamed protein product [Rotaria sordida]CAF4090216.1 unnamed protein product [Rotaria sordida]